MKKLSLFLAALTASTTVFSQTLAQGNTPPARGPRTQGYDAVIIKCLKDMARDPGSVVTRNIRLATDNYWIGQFNGRNGYGGMTGWVEFSFMLIADGQIRVIKIDEQIYYC
jgi:hypothetical protein